MTAQHWLALAGAGMTAASLTLPRQVLARDYEVQIIADDADDLYDMQAAGELEAEDVELLSALLFWPMDVNRADRYMLYDLPDVTWQLADAIVAYRAEHGSFTSVAQLGEVPGMTGEILTTLQPFVTVVEAGAVESGLDIRGRVQAGYIMLRQLGDDLRSASFVEAAPAYYLPNAYLQFSANGYTYFGAGGLITYRPLADVAWDRAGGRLLASDAGGHVNLDALYANVSYGAWRVIFGSYNIGFGERLTFDTTSRDHPRGWDESLNKYLRRDEGDVRPRSSLLGVAASAEGVDISAGWLDSTLFISYRPNDLYQYDLKYGFDDHYYADNVCERDSDCPEGYTCDADGTCRSSRIYDADDPDVSLLWQTIDNGFTELVGGGNVTVSFDERSHVGVTAYAAQTEMTVAEDADPSFSYSAQYPRYSRFGAAGVQGGVALGEVEVAGEGSLSFRGGTAAVARGVYNPISWSELELSLRYYGPDYENPHSRGQVSRLQQFGLSQRNEWGGRFVANLKPVGGLRLVTRLELFERPYGVDGFDDEGEPIWKHDPVSFLRLRQRVAHALTRVEEVTLQGDYDNNDLKHNGRKQFYESATESGYGLRKVGGGEKRSVRVTVSTRRLARTRLSLSYSPAWQDDGEPTSRASKRQVGFARQQNVRFWFSSKPWQGTRLSGSLKYWIDKPVTGSEPRLVAYMGLKQRAFAQIDLEAVYGVLMGRAGNDFEQFAALQLDARF